MVNRRRIIDYCNLTLSSPWATRKASSITLPTAILSAVELDTLFQTISWCLCHSCASNQRHYHATIKNITEVSKNVVFCIHPFSSTWLCLKHLLMCWRCIGDALARCKQMNIKMHFHTQCNTGVFAHIYYIPTWLGVSESSSNRITWSFEWTDCSSSSVAILPLTN